MTCSSVCINTLIGQDHYNVNVRLCHSEKHSGKKSCMHKFLGFFDYRIISAWWKCRGEACEISLLESLLIKRAQRASPQHCGTDREFCLLNPEGFYDVEIQDWFQVVWTPTFLFPGDLKVWSSNLLRKAMGFCLNTAWSSSLRCVCIRKSYEASKNSAS